MTASGTGPPLGPGPSLRRCPPVQPRARTAGGGPPAERELQVLDAAEPDEEVLAAAGVAGAAALALVYEDDDTNVRAALVARRLNPRLRLVIRLYNRKLGQHLEELLDQAAMVAEPGIDLRELDSSTTVLSDADTAAPALAASAVAGTSKVVQADGLLLRAVERTPPGRGEVADPGLCTLALLSATTSDPAGAEGAESSGDRGPRLLPDDWAVAAATGRGILALETVTHTDPTRRRQRLGAGALPVASLFSRRLRWSMAGMVAAVAALAVASWVTTGDHPLHAAYITLLDIFAINDPAVGDPTQRQVLQILAGFVGLLLLPVLVAAALEALGAFRTATVLRRPPRGLSGHVVLLGLGKIGTRVPARLRELQIPVVCVESDPQARGLALARTLRVPVIIGDVTDEGVLESARVHRAHSLLALTVRGRLRDRRLPHAAGRAPRRPDPQPQPQPQPQPAGAGRPYSSDAGKPSSADPMAGSETTSSLRTRGRRKRISACPHPTVSSSSPSPAWSSWTSQDPPRCSRSPPV